MYVMNDTADPFYVCMGSETCEANKPSGGSLCGPAQSCSPSPGLGTDAKITIAVVVPVVGVIISSVIVYVFLLRRRRRRDREPLSPAQDAKF